MSTCYDIPCQTVGTCIKLDKTRQYIVTKQGAIENKDCWVDTHIELLRTRKTILVSLSTHQFVLLLS